MNRFYLPVLLQMIVLTLSILVVGKYWEVGLVAWISGGVLTILTNAWFAFRVLSTKKVVDTKAFLIAANRGMIEKYCLAASGFAVIFVNLKPQHPLLVFLSCIVMYITHLVASVFVRRRPQIKP